MLWNRRRKDPSTAELRANLEQWIRTATCAENREMRLRAEFERVIDKLDGLYAAVFPGIEHTEDVLETVDAIDRYITAQATELKALREKIVEASDIRETAQRTQEVALEIADAVAEIRGSQIPAPLPPAMNTHAKLIYDWMRTPANTTDMPVDIFYACWNLACDTLQLQDERNHQSTSLSLNVGGVKTVDDCESVAFQQTSARSHMQTQFDS
jgi:hypothetical protein